MAHSQVVDNSTPSLPSPSKPVVAHHPVPSRPSANRTGPSPLRFSSTPSSFSDHQHGGHPEAGGVLQPSKRSFDQAMSSQSNPQLPPMDVDTAAAAASHPGQPPYGASPHASASGPRAPSPSPEPDRGPPVHRVPVRAHKPALAGLPPPYIPNRGVQPPQAIPPTQTQDAVAPGPPAKKPRTTNTSAGTTGAAAAAKATRQAQTERPLGTTLLPLARVQKIMRADKEMSASKEAVFLISVATEGFIKRLAQAGHKQARQEGRLTVQIKDLASAVQRNDELNFLEDIIPMAMSTNTALEKHKQKAKETPVQGPGSIAEAFSKASKTPKAAGATKGGKGKGKTTAATQPAVVDGQGADGDTIMDVSGDALGRTDSASSTSALTPSHEASGAAGGSYVAVKDMESSGDDEMDDS